MLVLSRKVGERIVIGDNVVVQVLEVRRWQVRLGICAPSAVPIRRKELPALPSRPGAAPGDAPGDLKPTLPED
jgi:carbon storage regulator